MTDDNLRKAQNNAAALFDDSSAKPISFGNPRGEYEAAQTACALFDLSDRTQFEITGADRAKFLHNFCTNEINGLKPAEGCEAFVTNIKGRVLGHVYVFCGEESIWIDSPDDSEEPLIAHLDRYLITEVVQLVPRTAEYGDMFVSGPTAAGKLSDAGLDPGKLKPYGHTSVESHGELISIRRVDLLGPAGYLLSARREHLAELFGRLVEAGIPPAGSNAFDVLRIEAVMPLYGLDISDENLAQEVSRTGQAISFSKGCYLGQEPIARLDSMGHVNRELCGLKLESGPRLEQMSTVVSPDDGKEIGHVTSCAQLSDGEPIFALAYISSKFSESGTTLNVMSGGQPIPATVYRSQS